MKFNHSLLVAGLSAALLTLSGCAGEANVKKEAKKAEQQVSLNNEDLYEIHTENRIYIFDDRAEMQSFLSVGEVPFRLTRIGAGPHGETVVFGLTKDDKKKGEKAAGPMMYDGKLKPADDFYAELMKPEEKRIYVFDNLDDYKHVHTLGHPSYMYTEIGAGPNGETLVYVLNKSNKKQKPVALIEKFHAMRK